MSAIGSGYDVSCMTYSPDGKVFQVEYAMKAVENSSTSIAIKCKDGIVVGAERLILSKMMEKTSGKRVFNLSKNIVMTCAGFMPDVAKLAKQAGEESENFKKVYGVDIPLRTLCERIATYINYYTLYSSYRPFGCSLLIGGWDHNGYQLYYLEPTGNIIGYFANGIGKGKLICKNELEKLNLNELTCEEALIHVIQILDLCHEEWKDKPYEIDLAWCCDETNHIVKKIDKEKMKKLINQARGIEMEEEQQQNVENQ